MEKRENVSIAYIGGGSRNWARTLMADLAKEADISGTVNLYDIDSKAAKDNEKIGNHLSQREDVLGKWEYKSVNSLEEAISGAEIIVISILPGTFEDMKKDVHYPEKYGIYQSVGDTIGPGGLRRANRTIPMYVTIAKAIKKYAPKAWVINYTNPMSICVNTLYKVFPEIKAFGCCHEVFGTQKLLGKMLKQVRGYDVKRNEIDVNVLGINHFTWFTKATYKNIDLFPLYKEFAQKYYNDGFIDEENNDWETDTFKFCERVKFDLFLKYGYIAAAGDRHLAEFVPEDYLKDEKCVKDWKYGITTVDWRVDDCKKKIEETKKLANFEEEVDLIKISGEEGVTIIKALLGLGDLVTNVNMPNVGQIENLPKGVVVETNALFTYDNVSPIIAGKIPDNLYERMTTLAAIQDNAVNSILNKDRKLLKATFEMDYQMKKLEKEKIYKLFEEMFDKE